MSSDNDSNLLLLSALQHLLYCPRQAALIHLERLWADNVLTVQGSLLHRRADKPGGGKGRRRPQGSGDGPTSAAEGYSTSGRLVPGMPGTMARAVQLRSLRLGMWGKADVVEFHPGPAGGAVVPFPVEYKRGRPKVNRCDEVQLCAQAICLEEMLGLPAGGVPAGAIFYGKTRRRTEVLFDRELRAITESAAAELHRLLVSGATPAAEYERKKCERCSLKALCLPERTGAGTRVGRYLAGFAELTTEPPAEPAVARSSAGAGKGAWR